MKQYVKADRKVDMKRKRDIYNELSDAIYDSIHKLGIQNKDILMEEDILIEDCIVKLADIVSIIDAWVNGDEMEVQ